ncbi:MAG: bis(5'-nucleosyl)-tetraphosphatase (symmetrical) YqeK [Verrucomicrobiota bacterium]|jgi:predicted HD superfamily hydrolase involved in NAD metabolism|nr:bis(5'-nucleosyl)-tetraphosphatase (symmetrical) YqeK [Verrucomicrobiota bacterium]MDP7048175.1 bis(5'-nucleosyl)-tetraphosphatase (symmetrical) YqeK [Verrucomicrobiota bacterium]
MANDPEQLSRIEAYLSENLSPARFKHVLGVRETAVALANRHGIDADQAELAALLHDCTKERLDNELVALAKHNGLPVDEYEKQTPGLLHGKVAPFVATEQFGVTDEVVCDAMRCHSTGAVKMGPLDQLLFVADFCEPNRPYTAAQEVRELAERDLEAAVLEVMQFKLRKTLLKKQPVHPDSFHAYNALLNKRNRETV